MCCAGKFSDKDLYSKKDHFTKSKSFYLKNVVDITQRPV